MKTRIKKETRIVDEVEEVIYTAQAFNFPAYFWWVSAEYILDDIGCWKDYRVNEASWGCKKGSYDYAIAEINYLKTCYAQYEENIRKHKQRKKVKTEYLK